MNWAVPQWWILFLGACASFVLSLVNIAWTWKQSKRVDDELRKRRELDAAARALIDELVDPGVVTTKETWRSVRRDAWEAAQLAERWGVIRIRWDEGQMQARVTGWRDRLP